MFVAGHETRIVRPHGRARGRTHALCSLATGSHIELLTVTAPTYDAFARAQGYDLVLSTELLARDRPAAWSKLALVTELLETYEVVIWLDADTVVMRFDREFPEPTGEQVMTLAHHPQERDPDKTVPNTGVFALKRCQRTTELLSEWRADREGLTDHNWWDNAAFLRMLGYSIEPPFHIVEPSEWRDRIGAIDLRWNSVPGYCESPEPAINHHARADHDDHRRRIDGMRADVVQALATDTKPLLSS